MQGLCFEHFLVVIPQRSGGICFFHQATSCGRAHNNRMISPLQQPELQQRTLRLYGELLCRRTHWGGELVMAAFAGAASSGLAAAASLAGAASLTVDADSAAMKAHFRDGAFDFVVNTLDESLRALKNEIRRGRPIAIGLIAEPEAVLREAAERGLTARLVVSGSSPSTLEKSVLATDGYMLTADSPSVSLVEWLARNQWHAAFPDENVSKAEFPAEDPRQHWLRNLLTHQRSAAKGARWSWVPQVTETAQLMELEK